MKVRDTNKRSSESIFGLPPSCWISVFKVHVATCCSTLMGPSTIAPRSQILMAKEVIAADEPSANYLSILWLMLFDLEKPSKRLALQMRVPRSPCPCLRKETFMCSSVFFYIFRDYWEVGVGLPSLFCGPRETAILDTFWANICHVAVTRPTCRVTAAWQPRGGFLDPFWTHFSLLDPTLVCKNSSEYSIC